MLWIYILSILIFGDQADSHDTRLCNPLLEYIFSNCEILFFLVETLEFGLLACTCIHAILSSLVPFECAVMYLQTNPGGITIFGWTVDRSLVNTIFFLELSLVTFVLGNTLISWKFTLILGPVCYQLHSQLAMSKCYIHTASMHKGRKDGTKLSHVSHVDFKILALKALGFYPVNTCLQNLVNDFHSFHHCTSFSLVLWFLVCAWSKQTSYPKCVLALWFSTYQDYNSSKQSYSNCSHSWPIICTSISSAMERSEHKSCLSLRWKFQPLDKCDF